MLPFEEPFLTICCTTGEVGRQVPGSSCGDLRALIPAAVLNVVLVAVAATGFALPFGPIGLVAWLVVPTPWDYRPGRTAASGGKPRR